MLIGILLAGHVVEQAQASSGDYDTIFPKLLKGQGLTFKSWNVVDMEFPESVNEANGWLITGSRHGAYEDLPFIKPLEDFICRAVAKDVPLVGICFGHQIIAQALGGRVEKFPGGWSVGRQAYDFDGEEIVMNAWHQDQVVERPGRAKVIGSSEFCENAALLYPGKAYTVQAHPEYDEALVDALLDYRAPGVVPDEHIAAARATKGEPNDSQKVADRIGAFFREHGHG